MRTWKFSPLKRDRNGNFTTDKLIENSGRLVMEGGSCEWEGVIIITSKADARIIEAAPDLLGATKLAYEALSEGKGFYQSTTAAKMRAAIAKADGPDQRLDPDQ